MKFYILHWSVYIQIVFPYEIITHVGFCRSRDWSNKRRLLKAAKQHNNQRLLHKRSNFQLNSIIAAINLDISNDATRFKVYSDINNDVRI